MRSASRLTRPLSIAATSDTLDGGYRPCKRPERHAAPVSARSAPARALPELGSTTGAPVPPVTRRPDRMRGVCIRSATDGGEGTLPGPTKGRTDAVDQAMAAQHCAVRINDTDFTGFHQISNRNIRRSSIRHPVKFQNQSRRARRQDLECASRPFPDASGHAVMKGSFLHLRLGCPSSAPT